MYPPNVDTKQRLSSVYRRLQTDPSPLGLFPDTVVSIWLRCNCVQFKKQIFILNREVSMGAFYTSDFSDIWMGEITPRHLDDSPVNTLPCTEMMCLISFSMGRSRRSGYWRITWITCILTWHEPWSMVRLSRPQVGNIVWKNNVGPDLCHDPAVLGSIEKGVGQRLRIISSKTEYFEKSVD